jgi:OmpA-OmpF porin, OOP family
MRVSRLKASAMASSALALLLAASPVFAQSNPLTETPGAPAPASETAPPSQAPVVPVPPKAETNASEPQQAQTTAKDATEIIRSLAPIAGGNPNAPRVRDVDADDGRRRVRVDYSRAIDLTVFFAYDSAELTPQARVQLEPLGRALATPQLLPHRFLIAGHTDSVGDAAYNRVLSLQRAIAVRDYLIQTHGIDPARLVAHGWGFTRLKDPRNPRSAVNRRVEVALIASSAPASHYGPLRRDGFAEPLPTVVTEENRLPVTVTVGNGRTIITAGKSPDAHVTVVPHRGPAYRWRQEWPREWQRDSDFQDDSLSGRTLTDPRRRLASDALDDFNAAPTPLARERPPLGLVTWPQRRSSATYDPATRRWSDGEQ